MRKLLNVIMGTLVGIVFFTGAPVLAQEATCDIGFTGPDSNNLCTSIVQYQCSVTNTNTVTIVDENNQVVASGGVATSGNTTGGSSTSGTVTNSNGATFSVTITNASEGEEGAACQATMTIPATVTPDVNPTVTPVASEAKEVAALPVTSGESTTQILGTIAAAAAMIAATSIVGVLLYRRKKSS